MSSARPATRWLLLLATLVVAGSLLWLLTRPPKLLAYALEEGALVQQVVATGRVISTSRSQVGSQITATVLERHVREGDRVEPGQVLVTLQAPELAAAVREAEAALQQLRGSTRPELQARLRQAEAQLSQASREAGRREDLFARALIARESLEQAQEAEAVARAAFEAAEAAALAASADGSEEAQLRERLAAARAQQQRTLIRAQRAGTVLTRDVEPGDLVQPGRVLFEIAHAGDTEIEVPVDEKNLSVLLENQPATCIADAWPERPFAASVDYIAPAIDAMRGTVVVRLRVEPVPAFLRPDMTVTVNIETGRRDRAVTVPNDALLTTRDGTPAVLRVTEGRITRIPVTTGLRGVAMTEVTAGLQSGDLVLADAAAVTQPDGRGVRTTLQAVPVDTASQASRREPPVQFN